ncbi:MAG TPA: amino acid adenylation domain-containing protein [Burkholderiales bacterium]|nr:amino acid adenylation domain-containing protein [Burkholderiales bacterium]
MTRPASSTLPGGFLRSLARFPERPALQLADQVLNYRQLHERAGVLAGTLLRAVPGNEPPLTAVFGHRSVTAYAGVLAALLRGHGYVPLNPAFPADRTRTMLVHSGCRGVIVDASGARELDQVLAGVAPGLTFVLPEHDDVSAFAARWPVHRFLGARELGGAAAPVPAADPDAIAYLLYTSGSTGQPKGVMVAHRNVTRFVDVMVERYGITEHDRFSQTFDLTFDLSAFDMFVAWERGACLCCPTQAQKMFPGKYISDCELTVWFSVPSTVALMSRLRMLGPGKYPRLRWSLFCGEALPADLMRAWAAAAPGSVLENLYGPTELTIACTLYRWDAGRSPAECEQGIVPIGEPYPGMRVLVADEAQKEVPVGEVGELLMTGPQLSLGYYKDPQRTAAAFVTPPGRPEVFYRTGDRVRRPAEGRPLVYLGRIDNQVKIQGYRVELGEIESVLREEAGVELAVAIGWPLNASGADGIVAFVAGHPEDTRELRERVILRLPPYMQPSEIRVVKEWPLNANGKIDRRALRDSLAK